MKSTGLFGKNSGRVGGVVYSNYRGQQIVRTYQPQVKNANTKKQVAQRAKFKLVSQVTASLSREIKMSFVPTIQKESYRNAFVREMLKKTTYTNSQASLPIEDIEITNSHVSGFATIQISGQRLTGVISPTLNSTAKVRIVLIGYNSGGEINLLGAAEPPIVTTEQGARTFEINLQGSSGYTNVRALAYVYEALQENGSSYEDYEVIDDEATLGDIIKIYSGKINFMQTFNFLVPQNV